MVAGSDMAFTEAAEFARSIQVAAPEEDPLAAAATASGVASADPVKAEEQSSHMGVDDEEPAPTPLPPPKQDPSAAPAAWGNWVSAEDAAGAAAAAAAAEDVDMADAKDEEEEEEDATEAPETREKPVGKGMASTDSFPLHADAWQGCAHVLVASSAHRVPGAFPGRRTAQGVLTWGLGRLKRLGGVPRAAEGPGRAERAGRMVGAHHRHRCRAAPHPGAHAVL